MAAIYITGLSGSGKSTIAKKIAEQINAIYINLDEITDYLIDNNYKVTWEKDPNNYHNRIIKYLTESKELYIIEGTQFFWPDLVDKKMVLEHGIIFIKTGFWRCSFRRVKRNFQSNKPFFKKIKHLFKYDLLRWYHIVGYINMKKLEKSI